MTGFGKAELRSAQGFIRVEMKATNHKFFEVSSRLPGHLAEFEEDIRKMIADKIRRGKILLFVSSPDPSSFSTRLVLNEALAKEVFHKTQRLRNLLKLDSRVNQEAAFQEVLRYPNVLTKDSSCDKRILFSKDLVKAIRSAMDSLDGSRLLEGRALQKDLGIRIAEIQKALGVIKKRIPVLAKEYKKNLENRIKDFIQEDQVDHGRLTLEVAQYAKNSDISEEVTRLASHLAAMRKTLLETGELGRKIDFIAQEMLRETNTIGAKSSDVTIANQVIQIKSAIEKIREQGQNVE